MDDFPVQFCNMKPIASHQAETNAPDDVPKTPIHVPQVKNPAQTPTKPSTRVDFDLDYTRPTFTNQFPAPYAVFNSITDNAAVGDERNFVRIREKDSGKPFRDEVVVEPGKEYEVYIYYHNNAASDTNESGYGIATDVRVAVDYPRYMGDNEHSTVNGAIFWSFVSPEDNKPHTAKVSDIARIVSKDSVTLRYKDGTAVIHNGGSADSSILPTALFSEAGTLIGYNKLGGVLPGCAEYSGHIIFTLIAE